MGRHGGASASITEQPLRDLADGANLAIGAAINTGVLREDAEYRAIVEREFNSVTAENVMKWEALEPEQGDYDYSEADFLVDFADDNDMAVRGHVLVWHNQIPSWVTDGYSSGDITADDLREILRDHVMETARHFRGDIYEWDVVNEYLADDGSVRQTIWTEALGEEYIFDVFRWARRADPWAKLYYNDYNLFFPGAKSDAALDLMREFQRRGVPIDGIGFQGHVGLQYGLDSQVYDNMLRFSELGLDLSVTEADVRYPLPDDQYNVAAQTQGYHMLLQPCLLIDSCNSFTVWGVSDQYSWIPDFFEGQGNALLWSDTYQPKPAYVGVQQDLGMAGMSPLRRTWIWPTP
jgi:endo-1,4-beta-xylanase